jgi:3-oxoadipate enol-lactonase
MASDEQWSRGSTEQLISTTLGSINIRIGGRNDGPTMVFWPSLVMNGSMWRHQYEHYSPTHRVILIDPPGIGKSDRLTTTITLQQCSDCLLEILDVLGIDRCVLVGNSWGSILAGVFAAEHPQRLIGAVAANGTASATTLLDKLKLGPLIGLLGLHPRTPRWFAAVTQSTFAGRTAQTSKPAFLESLRCVLGEDPKSIAWQMRSILLRRPDTHRQLSAINNVPVLVMAGEEDRQFPVLTEKDVAATIPGSTFVVLPKTGHLSALESPELFNKAVDDFLHQIRPGADT